MTDSQSRIDMAKPSRLPADHRQGGIPAGRIARLFLLLFCVAAVAVFAGSPSRAETRSLKIYNVHTGEKNVITYKRNGHYVPAGLKKLNYILRDWRKDRETRMDPRLLDLLWSVYRKSGSRDYIHIICGYRTADTNAMLRGRSRSSGVAKKSQHILGKAADFYIPDVKLEKLREIGMKFQVGGVGYYPRSGSPFVHMDTGWVRAWPRMSRKQLVRLFPKGETLHLPPDGKRLPGYQAALASYKQRVTGDSIMVAGGGVSSSHRSGGNLLAALFGSGQGDEDEGGVTTGSVSPRQHAATRTASVGLPDTPPLPGVRSDYTAPPAAADAGAAPADEAAGYADLMVLASVPIPQAAPGRETVPAAPTAAAAASLVADAGTESAAPVPSLRPELVAYAPSEDSVSFPTLSKTPVPSLRPTSIIASAKVRMRRNGVHSAAQALTARLKAGAEAEPREFATVSGDAVRGGRLDGGPAGSPGSGAALTEDMIARWARAQDGYVGRVSFTQPASRRMSRIVREPWVSQNAVKRPHESVDPLRFAALGGFFTSND